MKAISTESVNTSHIVNELYAKANINDYAACIVFIHAELDIQEILQSLNIQIPYIGSSVLSVYCDDNETEETVSILLIPKRYNPTIGLLKDVADNSRCVFALSDKDKDLTALASQYAFFGGTASDVWTFDKTTLILNGQLMSNTSVAVAFDAQYSTLHSTAWQIIPGTESLVTEATGACVKRIGDMTALDYYKTIIPSIEAFGAYPIYLHDYAVYRAALNVDLNESSITFSSDIPQGTAISATTTRRNALIQSTNRLITESKNMMYHGADLTIMVSCAARNLMLSDVPHFEHKALLETTRKAITVYLYSEFVPQGNGTTLLQNQHAVIKKIRSDAQ